MNRNAIKQELQPMIGPGPVIAVLAGLVAFLVTLLVYRNASRLGAIQAPNSRSSHTMPTATGGGIGIVAGGTLAGLPTLFILPLQASLVLVASVLIAVVGFLDDRYPMRVTTRLGAQTVLSTLVVVAFPLERLAVELGLPVSLWLLIPLLVLAGVAWINIFNFMDGIDGLAASQAIFMLLAAGGLCFSAADNHPVYWWMIALAASALGFLILNWPPARIFMGDAGSTYLGLMVGLFALCSVTADWLSIWQWMILAGTFLADGLVTLLRRLIRRERVWLAHRRHAYQFLQRRFGSHAWATLLYAGINLVWLLPLAWWAGQLGQQGWMAVIVAYAVLVPAALWAGAGSPWEPKAAA